eukprot:g6787.t1
MRDYDVQRNPAEAAEKVFGDVIANLELKRDLEGGAASLEGESDPTIAVGAAPNDDVATQAWWTDFTRQVILPVQKVFAGHSSTHSWSPSSAGSLAIAGLKMDVFTMVTQQVLYLLQKHSAAALRAGEGADNFGLLTLSYTVAAMTTDQADLWFRGGGDNHWQGLFEYAIQRGTGTVPAAEGRAASAYNAAGMSWNLAKRTSFTVFVFENLVGQLAGDGRVTDGLQQLEGLLRNAASNDEEKRKTAEKSLAQGGQVESMLKETKQVWVDEQDFNQMANAAADGMENQAEAGQLEPAEDHSKMVRGMQEFVTSVKELVMPGKRPLLARVARVAALMIVLTIVVKLSPFILAALVGVGKGLGAVKDFFTGIDLGALVKNVIKLWDNVNLPDRFKKFGAERNMQDANANQKPFHTMCMESAQTADPKDEKDFSNLLLQEPTRLEKDEVDEKAALSLLPDGTKPLLDRVLERLRTAPDRLETSYEDVVEALAERLEAVDAGLA